jgi:DNA-binding transcriptional LysR family regulator
MSWTHGLLGRGLKLSHLQMIVAFAEAGQLGAAAVRLGITQPAASRLLSEVETILGTAVRARSGRGVVLTEAGRVLAGRAGRVMHELQEAAREVTELSAGGVGRVRIGAVTAPALDMVLPALRTARLSHPKIQSEVVVASSDILCDQLAAGRLDFVLGRVPQGVDAGQFDGVVIAAEPVTLVVRRGHRLAEVPPKRLAEVLEYDWVMPGEDNPLARAVLARLGELGLPRPSQRLSTASFLLTLALLRQSNVVAPLARAVADQFATGPDAPLVQVEAEFGIEVVPYSLLTRKGARLTAAAETVLGLIRMAF